MSASSRTVDFTNVKDGGLFNRSRIPAGDYAAKIIKVEDAEAKDETFQYLFTIQILKRPSSKLPYYCKLVDNQLWKLRNLLIAAGKTVPKSKQKVDVNQLVNKIIGVTIEDDEYDGKEQSTISGVFPAAELAGEGDDDDDVVEDEPTEDDDDSLDDLDDSATSDDDEDEEPEEEPEPEVDPFDPATRTPLKAAIKKLQPDFVAKKSQTNADLQTLLDSLSKPKAKAATKKKAAEVTDDELEELDLDAL